MSSILLHLSRFIIQPKIGFMVYVLRTLERNVYYAVKVKV